MPADDGGWTPVHRVVRRIPEGRVATYGQVAGLAGMPGAARQVGWALHALEPDDDVPWQRVINARGEISSRGEREIEGLQRALLEAEGVEFDARGRVDLDRFGWAPRARKRSASQTLDKTRAPKQAARAGNKKTKATGPGVGARRPRDRSSR